MTIPPLPPRTHDDHRACHLIDADDVAALRRMSRRSVWRWTKAGALPKPVKRRGLGQARTLWCAEQVAAWYVDPNQLELPL